MSIFSDVQKVTDEVELQIARSIRAGLEGDVNPGNSVNATANPLQIQILGSYDLLKLGRRVLADLKAFATAKESAARKLAESVKAEAEKVAGAVKAEAEKVGADLKTVVQDAEHFVLGEVKSNPQGVARAVEQGVADAEKIVQTVQKDA